METENQNNIEQTQETVRTSATSETEQIVETTDNNNTSEINSTPEEQFDFKTLLHDEALEAIKEYGFVDETGNIWIKQSETVNSKIIGKLKEKSTKDWYKAYLDKFEDYKKKFEKLKEEFNKVENKNVILSKIGTFIDQAKTIPALGNFDTIIKELNGILDSATDILNVNFNKKEELCAKAETISESKDFKKAANELKELQKDWKHIGAVPREKQNDILQRFNAAIDRFYERQRNNFEEQEIERWENYKLKEKLVERAIELCKSTNWKKTSDELKKMQIEWKTIGPIPREKADTIWKKFRETLDSFYDKQKEHFNVLDSSKQENLEKKQQLCNRAKLLSESVSWKETIEELKKLQDEWKAIGPVPLEQSDDIWKTFRSYLDTFYSNMRQHYGSLDKERHENYEKKVQLCTRAESLCNSTEWELTAEELKRLRQEWKLIGPVPTKQSDAMWKRFRKAIDIFFEKRRGFIDTKKHEFELRKTDFKNRLSDTIKRKKTQITRIKEEIKSLQDEISKTQEKLNIIINDDTNLIKESLAQREDEINKIIQNKSKRIVDLEKDIKDIETKIEKNEAKSKKTPEEKKEIKSDDNQDINTETKTTT
jgi:hypothetical protein